MPIPAAAITENYAALTILRQSQLNTAIGDNVSGSVEYYLNTNVRNNLNQIALDVFGVTYDYTNDGIASMPTPLAELVGYLAQNEVITGAWTFNGAVAFSQPVTSTSTFTSSAQPRCSVYRVTTNQFIPDNTATAISFGAESYDVGGLHSTSVLPTRIIIPTGGAGVYQFLGQATFDNNAVGLRALAIYKNGGQIAITRQFAPDAAVDAVFQVQAQDTASEGDYYELYATQSSGGGLDIVLGQYNTFFSAMKVW